MRTWLRSEIRLPWEACGYAPGIFYTVTATASCPFRSRWRKSCPRSPRDRKKQEQAIIEYCHSTGFTVEGLKRLLVRNQK